MSQPNTDNTLPLGHGYVEKSDAKDACKKCGEVSSAHEPEYSADNTQLGKALAEIVERVFVAGFQSGKKSGLTMVIASGIVEPEAVAEIERLITSEMQAAEPRKLPTPGSGINPEKRTYNHGYNAGIAAYAKKLSERIGE